MAGIAPGAPGGERVQAALSRPLFPGPGRVRASAWAVGGAALIGYPFVFQGPYPQHVMILVFHFALMAQAWNVLAGYCGQISLGHAVFFGLGAYAAAYPFVTWGLSPWLGMGLGMGIAALVAIAIGLPLFRLRGHYFAIATLLIGESVQIVFQRWDAVGGASGIWLPIVRENSLLVFQFHESKLPYYYIALALLVVGCLVVWRIERTRLGFYFRAIREDPEAAASLGVNVSLYKAFAYMISGAMMAAAGSFYAQYEFLINPQTVFPLETSILVVLMAVMGGAGTLWGPLLGAAVLVPLSEATRVYLGGTGQTLDLVIYGTLIVLICVLKPEGLVGLVRDWRRSRARETLDGHARG